MKGFGKVTVTVILKRPNKRYSFEQNNQNLHLFGYSDFVWINALILFILFIPLGSL